jgi:DNA-directed RNA polymerase alpha subunit
MSLKRSLHDSIDYLVWTMRTRNVLRQAGIETFGQLCAVKEGEILRMPNAAVVRILYLRSVW